MKNSKISLLLLCGFVFISAQVMASGKKSNESPDHYLEYLRRCMNRGLMDQEREIQAGMWNYDYDSPWYAYVDGVAQYDESWEKRKNKTVEPALEQVNQAVVTEKKSEIRTMRFPGLYDSIEEEDLIESMNARTSARLSGSETLEEMMDRDRCEGTHDAENMVNEIMGRAHLDLANAYIDLVKAKKKE